MSIESYHKRKENFIKKYSISRRLLEYEPEIEEIIDIYSNNRINEIDCISKIINCLHLNYRRLADSMIHNTISMFTF